MDARSFFDIRIAVPGYSFILSFLVPNIGSLCFLAQRIANSGAIQFLGIVFGFLTILSGAAIGFLISQPWYLIYNVAFKTLHTRWIRKSLQKSLPKVDFKDYDSFHTIYNYVVHSEKNSGVHSYLDRRLDLFNLMCSSIIAVLLGLGVGYAARNYFTVPQDFMLKLTSYVNLASLENIILLLTLVVVIALLAGAINVLIENKQMIVLLMELKDEKKILKLIFPSKYFAESGSKDSASA